MVCPPCAAPSGLRKRPREDEDDLDDRPRRAKGPHRSLIGPGSPSGRPRVSLIRQRLVSDAVEPAR
eukprot:16449757-Heterocapsa_arctica.AAC.1